MRVDSKGLFWSDTDYKTEKKETLLDEQEWMQVFPGFWAEQHRVESGEDIRTICVGLDTAYLIAKAEKTGERCVPPDPVWLAPDYLPGLVEAREFNVPLLTEEELVTLSYEIHTKGARHKFIYDIECYGNYFLVAFISIELGKVFYMELSGEEALNCPKLTWVFETFCLVGFNSNGYDIWIATMAAHGCSTAAMKSATTAIIEHGERGWQILRRNKIKKLKCDHIDLIEVAPLFASLKIYGGRMHTAKMQDLPFSPNTVLSEPQRAIIRWYCINDLRNTLELNNKLSKELELREEMGAEYGVDLRSKSDAQIAEVVIGDEIARLNRCRPHKPKIEPGTAYHYNTPNFVHFSTPLMQGVLQQVQAASFVVSEFGNIGLPEQLKELAITMNHSTYQMGIGGLHSTEKNAAHFAGPDVILKDVDVTSYYPYIILILGLYPQHLGPNFLTVYKRIVDRRVAAKIQGDKSTANSLKIVVNGSFGKLGSMHSILYAPDLLIQVTITGQLSLLMLIERLELAGIPVVSANTDGIVIKAPRNQEALTDSIIEQWERDTGFNMEETVYKCLFSRDVNNYFAITDPSTWKPGETDNDHIKSKGIFATPGLSKNPQNEVCVMAIKALLLYDTPVEETIRGCKDITKFLNVRTVKGGAVKLYEKDQPGLFLGKAIRWYYGKDIPGRIVYANSGKKVPKSDGAQPLMELPATFPTDIDYMWYEKEAAKILKKMGGAV